MTEREYVEAIRAAAQNYLNTIRGIDATAADFKNWNIMKEGLSASTMIAMCNAWLESNDARTKAHGLRSEGPGDGESGE